MVPLRRLLQRELLVLIGLLAVLSALLAWMGMGRSLEQQIQARSKESLARLSSGLTDDLAQLEHIGGTVDRWRREGRISFQDLPAAEAQIAPLLEEFKSVANLVFVSVDGWGLSMSRLEDGLSSYHLDARKPQGMKRYFRKAGQPFKQGEWEPTPYKVFNRPWWNVASDSSSARWVDVYRFVNTPTHGISYVIPFRSASGELQGAMCVDIFLKTLNQRVWDAQPTPHAQVLVSDAHGVALILPKGTPTEASIPGGLPFLRPMGRDFLPLFEALQRRWEVTPGKDAPFHLRFGGERYTCSVQPLTAARGVNWRLSLAIPDRDFLGPVRRLSLQLLIAGLCIMGLAAWRVVRIARWFSAPLEQLAGQAQSMGEGVMPGPVETPIKEFRTLGEALQRAGGAIQEEARLQGQLQRSQRVQVVGTLTGGIAHDVNNQLAAIVGQLDMGRQSLPPDHPALQRMELAVEAAYRCSAMVRSLLRFTHQTRHEFHSVNLNELVKNTANLLSRLLGGRIQLDLELDPTLCPIQGDPVGLEQVIMNLAVNARDAMPEGGRLQISTSRDGDGMTKLTVRDTGTGIPEAILSHIFEPFFSTKEAELGHGLGLAMVAGIIRAHGGRIDVQSPPGRGTTVQIFLPVGSVETEAPHLPAFRSRETVSLQGLRILVVEDEAYLRDLLVELLEGRGATVTAAQDGAQGWERTRQQAFDLIVCDQQMPHMTGLEMLARLREQDSTTPVILTSGHGLEGLGEDQLGDPHVRVLAKPFGMDRLQDLIGELL